MKRTIIWAIVLVIFILILFQQFYRYGELSIKEAEVEKQLWKERSNYFQLLDKYCKDKGFQSAQTNKDGVITCIPLDGK
ncbi:MAG: hypothetical protein PHE48_02885 [Candidatus Daviesbacteria bacterium]|nr:hypothetical protein [Candidatus Daviesbacteria bacterium]